MARGHAISWSQSETDNLLLWLYRNRHLSWEGKSRAYFLQHRVVRSVESLRGKKYQLLRKERKQQRPLVPGGTKKRRRQYLLRRKPRDLPESPPILRVGSPDPELWQMVQNLQVSLETSSLRSSQSMEMDSDDGKSLLFPFETQIQDDLSYTCRVSYAGNGSFRSRTPVLISLGGYRLLSFGSER